jgi:hypothetical protein
MKFKSKVTFLVSGEIHDDDVTIRDVLNRIEVKVKLIPDNSNKELWPYTGTPSCQIRKFTINSIKKIDD